MNSSTNNIIEELLLTASHSTVLNAPSLTKNNFKTNRVQIGWSFAISKVIYGQNKFY